MFAVPTVRWLVPSLALLAIPWLVYGQGGAARFDQYLDSLRIQAGIPGLSAAIVQDRAVVWEKGFGEADVERNIAASPNTPYPVGGLTATLSAVLALRCAEEGRLELDAPVVSIWPTFGDPTSTIRQVLGHVVAGRYVYDLQRYDAAAAAISACTEKTLRAAVVDDILDRFAMADSVPGQDFLSWSDATAADFPAATVARYGSAMTRMAKGYRSNGRGSKPTPTSPAAQPSLSGGSGLVASAHDLARLQAALDDGSLLNAETLGVARTAPTLADGRPSPHAMGWFVGTYEKQLVAWQFGVIPDGYSALVMTLPQRGVTLILLANSDGLVEPFRLANGDISVSPFAKLFFGLFS